MNQEQLKQFYEANCANKAIPREKSKNNFNDNWKFPNDVRQTYGKYTKYEIAPLDEKF